MKVRPLRRAAAGAVLVGLLSLTAVTEVGAQPARSREDDQPAVSVIVESFTGVLAADDELQVRVRVRSHTTRRYEDLRVSATLHRRVRSRFDYQQAVETGAVGARLGGVATRRDRLPGRASRVLHLSARLDEVGLGDRAEPGVYPLRIRLEGRGEVLDEVATSVVLLPAEVEQPVAAAFLLPLDHAPGLLANGTYHGARVVDAIGPGGRLRQLVDLVADDATFPVTVVTNALVLDQVRDLADGFTTTQGGTPQEHAADGPAAQAATRFLDRLRTLLHRRDVEHVALPYGPADLAALVARGMAPEAIRHITSGVNEAAEIIDVQPVQDLLVPADALSARSLTEAVVPAGMRTLVLSEDWLQLPDDRELLFTPSPLRRLRSGSGARLVALVPDPWLEDALRASPDEGDAVAAQRVLAETATVYFERPFASEPRGLLLAPPRTWSPPAGMAAALLAGLRDAPWLRPTDLRTLVAAMPAEKGVAELAYSQDARERQLPRDYVDELAKARAGLASLTNMLAAEDPRAAGYDRLLRTAAAVHYRSRSLRDEGWAMIKTVSRAVADLYTSVDVADGLPITLTGREGQIPVTVTNRAPVPLAVTVTLATSRYAFDDGAQRTLELPADETVTVGFRGRVLTPGGTYPIRVVVTDAQGARQVASGSLVVRSTAASPVALVITAGSSAFLLGWWLQQVRLRRRARADADSAAERRAA